MKRNKGAISLFALLAMMFFLIFIMVAYNNVAAKGKTQVETTAVLVEEYKSDTSSADIYTQMNAGNSSDANIKTNEQKTEITKAENNGQYIAVDGKIYKIVQ